MNLQTLISPRIRGLISIVVESSIIITSFVTAVSLRYEAELLVPKALLVTLVLELCFYYGGLHGGRTNRRRTERFLRLGQSYLVAMVLLSLVYYVFPDLRVGRGIQAIFFPLSFISILLWRELYFWIFAQRALNETVLILGTGATAIHIAKETLKRSPLGYNVKGFLGEHPAEVGRRLVNPHVIGTVSDLTDQVEDVGATLIVVALEDRRKKMPVQELLHCRLSGIRVEEAPDFYEKLTGRVLVSNLRPSWIVFSQGFNKPRYLRSAKQLGEFLFALVLTVVMAPLFLLLAILIKIDSRGPVFYRQERVGENSKLFALFKLRTMRADAESKTGPIWASSKADCRITRVGHWLRKTRLDELPQLFNVLRGEMSFVGPRPERPYFVDQLRKVIPYYDERHSVKPGITGWAQINYRYGATIEDTEMKLEHDLYYIKHMSLLLDFAIILDTFKVMVLGKGAR